MFGTIHVVEVHFVQHQRPFTRHRVAPRGIEAVVVYGDMHRPMKLMLVEIEAQNTVEAR